MRTWLRKNRYFFAKPRPKIAYGHQKSFTGTSPLGTAKERRDQFIASSEIEGLHMDDDTRAMFEMFDREGWDNEKREAYILSRHTHSH